MRSLSMFVLVAMLSSLMLAGCLVRTRGHSHGHGHSNARRAKSCPPAYHWHNGRCVHNGRGKAKGHRR